MKFQIKAKVIVDGKILIGGAEKFTVEVKGGVALGLAVGVGVGAVVFVLLVAFVGFVVYRKRNPPYEQVVRLENGKGKKIF